MCTRKQSWLASKPSRSICSKQLGRGGICRNSEGAIGEKENHLEPNHPMANEERVSGSKDRLCRMVLGFERMREDQSMRRVECLGCRVGMEREAPSHWAGERELWRSCDRKDG